MITPRDINSYDKFIFMMKLLLKYQKQPPEVFCKKRQS